MKLILFDIDSTLLRDGGAAQGAFNQAFVEQFGTTPGYIDKYGKTDLNIAQETARVTLNRDFSQEEFRLLHERYCELYPPYLTQSSEFRLCPGVMELCRNLYSDRSCILGIQTGNFEVQAKAKLEKAALTPFFRFGGYGSDCPDRAELIKITIDRGMQVAGRNVPKSAIFVIGDSVHDVRAGKNNGVFSIGVTTGANSEEELFAAGADAVVKDLTEESGIFKIISRK